MDLFLNKNKNSVILFISILVAYYLEIIFELTKLPFIEYLPYFKSGVLLLLFFIMYIFNAKKIWTKYFLTLFMFISLMELSKFVNTSNFLYNFFTNDLLGGLANNIVSKVISSFILFIYLIITFRNTENNYLSFGNPKVMVSKIKFLGIKDNEINWGKLSLISGVLIGFGTSALTILTVIGQISSLNIEFLISSIPVILLLALMNSFSEGLFFRSSIFASLDGIANKQVVIWVSALIFGSFHFHGAPGGIIGVVMSTILGWYLARSVYETKGILCAWFIHFCQDVVIFSTIVLLTVL